MNWKIWILVPVVYGVFSLWYFNWRGPISAVETDSYVNAFVANEGSQHTDVAVFRKFIEEDDGSEFVMLNLVELHEGDITHPLSGEEMSASNLVREYFEPFALELLKHGGHPVFQARRVGGNLDSWNAEDNLSFGVTGMMRYRSRRDLAELIFDPKFADGHIYKLAAIDRTISYPTRIMMSTSMRPPLAFLIVLLLIASVVRNVSYISRYGPRSTPSS